MAEGKSRYGKKEYRALEEYSVNVEKVVLNRDFVQHSHDFDEIVLILSGTGEHLVGSQVYPLKRRDVFVIKGDTCHGFRRARELSMVNVMYDSSLLFAQSDRLRQVAGNAPHMANTHPALPHEIPAGVADTGNLVKMYHAVPTRHMKSRSGDPAPFGLQCFTEDQWGATMRYHYNRDMGETVTMVRFNPQGTRLLAAKGVIVTETDYDKIGCDTGLLVSVANKGKFFKAQCNYGHHMTWAYGDIADQLEDLGDMLGFQVERV